MSFAHHLLAYVEMFARDAERMADVRKRTNVLPLGSAALAGTTWTGPARDQFESDWNTSFRTALGKLNQAFDAAGSDCIARSTDLQRVMGAR